jgi:nucleoside-diphosphate-sugar epimerase
MEETAAGPGRGLGARPSRIPPVSSAKDRTMRVFVTGGTGFIGSALVRELLDAGHEVLALARSDAGAKALTEAGARPHRGDLDDLDALRAGAASAEAVAHLAYNHDLSDFEATFAANARKDLTAIEAMGGVLEGSGRPLVIASGTLMAARIAGPGVVATEDVVADPASTEPRIASENAALALARRGVRTSIARFAPTVHGTGDHGFMPRLVAIAREKGFSGYVGDGANRWPAVHRLDAARLLRLALESAPAGTRLHVVAEEGVAFREIAEAIGRGVGVPVRPVAAADAAAHFGFLGALVGVDNPTSGAATRELLGWRPTHPTLFADIAAYASR